MKPLRNSSAFRTRAPAHVGRRGLGFMCRSPGWMPCPRPMSPCPLLNASTSIGLGHADKPSPCQRISAAMLSGLFRFGAVEKSPPLGVTGKMSEEHILKFLYSCRFFTLLGVSGSLVGSILCFIKGCVYIASSFMEYFIHRGRVIPTLIEAIDIYLIGTVMLVFGMGLYELFICNLDVPNTSSDRSSLFGLFKLQERPSWLEIKTVDELKTKLGQVIVIFLLVGLLEKSLNLVMSSPMDILCFAASIFVSSCGLFLLSRLKN